MTLAQAGLANLTMAILNDCIADARAHEHNNYNPFPLYLPLLTQVDLESFAVQVVTSDRQIFSAGNIDQQFVLMSVIKPFVLLFLLESVGADRVFQVVDALASHLRFDALPQESANHGKPYNPMLNTGAIALGALLPGADSWTRCENLRLWLNQIAQTNFDLDMPMVNSAKCVPSRQNVKIAQLLQKFGYVADAAIALDTYEHFCCLAGTVADLANLGLLLTGQHSSISRSHVRIVNAILTTCGLYEASGTFAVQAGLPSKSGVSGAWLSVVPHQGAIACYSPALDRFGNSIFCANFVQRLSSTLSLSIFT